MFETSFTPEDGGRLQCQCLLLGRKEQRRRAMLGGGPKVGSETHLP